MASRTTSYHLIERSRGGDSDAFSSLYERYHRRLAVLIHYKLGPNPSVRLDAEDILQQTFFAVYRDFASFEYRDPGSFFSWLSRIADHIVLDDVRSQTRLKRNGGRLLRFRSRSNPGGPDPADTMTPSRWLAEREAVRRLLDRLNLLPDNYREIILLAKVQRLTTLEISERLGISREKVAVSLHRAIQRFRAIEGR